MLLCYLCSRFGYLPCVYVCCFHLTFGFYFFFLLLQSYYPSLLFISLYSLFFNPSLALFLLISFLFSPSLPLVISSCHSCFSYPSLPLFLFISLMFPYPTFSLHFSHAFLSRPSSCSLIHIFLFSSLHITLISLSFSSSASFFHFFHLIPSFLFSSFLLSSYPFLPFSSLPVSHSCLPPHRYLTSRVVTQAWSILAWTWSLHTMMASSPSPSMGTHSSQAPGTCALRSGTCSEGSMYSRSTTHTRTGCVHSASPREDRLCSQVSVCV